MSAKSDPPRQLALDLALKPGFEVADFLVSASNEIAYAMLEQWPDWPGHILLLLGPGGAGKSHLAHIWAARARATVCDAHDVATAGIADLRAAALLIEDLDRAAIDEAAFFHLANLVREEGRHLLITARSAPDHWGLRTPDLLSRLRLAPSISIGRPDEALIRSVLVKLFVDQQIVVDTALIEFAARRLDRSLDSARRFVAALNREALARGRRVTRVIAADVLSELTGDDE